MTPHTLLCEYIKNWFHKIHSGWSSQQLCPHFSGSGPNVSQIFKRPITKIITAVHAVQDCIPQLPACTCIEGTASLSACLLIKQWKKCAGVWHSPPHPTSVHMPSAQQSQNFSFFCLSPSLSLHPTTTLLSLSLACTSRHYMDIIDIIRQTQSHAGAQMNTNSKYVRAVYLASWAFWKNMPGQFQFCFQGHDTNHNTNPFTGKQSYS